MRKWDGEKIDLGHSIINQWENLDLRVKTATLGMNFTRFQKNGEVSGARAYRTRQEEWKKFI